MYHATKVLRERQYRLVIWNFIRGRNVVIIMQLLGASELKLNEMEADKHRWAYRV